MMNRYVMLLMLICGQSMVSSAQIDTVRVELYYITDEKDATDTTGGGIEAGFKTYRIFIDVLPGTKLLGLYGDEKHPLVFSSTTSFYNHKADGFTFGKELSRTRYENGTVPLDTYITLGQCSRPFAQGAYFGVSKNHDQDGSIVGGQNNDGGSAGIASGLLTNEAEELGIPLPVADGMQITNNLPTSWIDIGFIDLLTSTDTTIFGSNTSKSTFVSTNALLRNSGITASLPDNHEILIAQLTTKGDISFELNLEMEILVNNIPTPVNYVARNENLGEHDVFIPLLSYPYACGCKDPEYLEASTIYACEDNSKCITPVVLGCMDPLACNYNPVANYNLQGLCCYIGYCHDMDISLVCPDLQPRNNFQENQINLLPNPALDELRVVSEFPFYTTVAFVILDVMGREVGKGLIGDTENRIDLSDITKGFYCLRISSGKQYITKPFVKL